MTESKQLKTGTTTVGLVCKDCIVLAADTRATKGHFIADPNVDKVIPITDYMAVTIAGTASTALMLAKHISIQLKSFKITSNRDPTVKEAASLLRNWTYGLLRNSRAIPDIAHVLLAGHDKYGQHLYDIDFDGMLTKKEEYEVSGSGTMFVLGVLENEYKTITRLGGRSIFTAVRSLRGSMPLTGQGR